MQENSTPVPGPSVASLPGQQIRGTLPGEAKAWAFTTVHWVLVGTILAIRVTVARPPLGDTVSVVALEVGGLAGVIDGCQQERGGKASMLPSPPLPTNCQGADQRETVLGNTGGTARSARVPPWPGARHLGCPEGSRVQPPDQGNPWTL